jgi:hypothetical protein
MEKAEASRISRAVSWQCPAFPLELRCLLGAQSLRTGMRLCQRTANMEENSKSTGQPKPR